MTRELVHFCANCGRRVEVGFGAWRYCPDCGFKLKDRTIARPLCNDYTPPTYSGPWRDWHRGHGCHLDDGKKPPRTVRGGGAGGEGT